MKPKKLNVRLIRKIQKHIMAEPRRLLMRSVKLYALGPNDSYVADDFETKVPYPDCGTAQCIAGWALTLSGRRLDTDMSKAARLLNLDAPTGRVFAVCMWPYQFISQYSKAKTPLARAKVACKRLDYLVRTGK